MPTKNYTILNLKCGGCPNHNHPVQELKCGGCSSQIEDKLARIKGVSNVKVDKKNSIVQFDYSEDRQLETVADSLQKMGYPLVTTKETDTWHFG